MNHEPAPKAFLAIPVVIIFLLALAFGLGRWSKGCETTDSCASEMHQAPPEFLVCPQGKTCVTGGYCYSAPEK